MKRIVQINESLCTGCGACAKICPRRILIVDGVCRVTNEARCDRYRGCEHVCPTGAIRII